MKTSASKIIDANYCKMRYYLKHVLHEKADRLSVYEKGIVIHDLIRNFWKRLGTAEEVSKKSSKKKYSNSEEFAEYAGDKWMQRVTAAEKSGKLITWRFDNEKWVFRATIPKICMHLFPILFARGEPLFSELPFDFVFGNKEFSGRIDEIRLENGKVKIIDYKSGWPWMGEMKVKTDPQLTLYNPGLCSLCYSNPDIARPLGLEDRLRGNIKIPMYIDPGFEEQFFMVEAPYYIKQIEEGLLNRDSPKIILPTHRTEKHFSELIGMVETIQRLIDKGEVYPERGAKCESCDVKHPCEKKLNDGGEGFSYDKKGQMFFGFAIPRYARKEENKNRNEKKLQPTLGLRRDRVKK